MNSLLTNLIHVPGQNKKLYTVQAIRNITFTNSREFV